MTSENTEQTAGENIEENKKNLGSSENPEQQAVLATSVDLHKQPEGNKEGGRFLEKQPPHSTAGTCGAEPAKDAKLDSSLEKHARGRSRERKKDRKKRRSPNRPSSSSLLSSWTSSSYSSSSSTRSISSEDIRRSKNRKHREKCYLIKTSK